LKDEKYSERRNMIRRESEVDEGKKSRVGGKG
jgi:hypothetical protein